MRYLPLCLLISGLFVCFSSFAQSETFLHQDADWPYRTVSRQRSQQRAVEPDTLSISAASPFFDDFTYEGPLPDSGRWFISTSNFDAPFVNGNRAVNPPTYGVASFDGVDRFNRPYDDENLTRGLCDQLVSHYIDLSGYDQQDQLWLSFALQPQGRGDQPESNDSFLVYFFMPDLNVQRKVYARGGSPLHGFEQISIPIDQSEYFQTRFQLIFESNGSQNGQLDQWHLDYVYLAPGRSANDTLFDDFAPVEISAGPIGAFSAVPLQQFSAGSNFVKPFTLRYHNLNAGNIAVVSDLTISDPVGGNVFGGLTSQSLVVPLGGSAQQSINAGAFTHPTFTQPGVIQLSVSMPNDDAINSNNILTRNYRIDSLLAYDDGEADQGFGLNKPWGFANGYYTAVEDSIQAVWVSFVPTMYYNPITTQVNYMDEASFRLTIWKDPNPDSILIQQIGGSKVSYGSSPNQFVRFPLSSPVAVKDSFWVGIVQISSEPIGVGWDQNNTAQNLIWWDSAGVWTLAHLQGSLMIRPEFQAGVATPAAIQAFPSAHRSVYLFPNPVGGERRLQIQMAEEAVLHDYIGSLYDGQGQLVMRITQKHLLPDHVFELPASLPPGLYIWQHQANQGAWAQTEKLMIQ